MQKKPDVDSGRLQKSYCPGPIPAETKERMHRKKIPRSGDGLEFPKKEHVQL